MNVYYSDHYPYPLPDGHDFPAEKYAQLRFELLRQSILVESDLHPSPPAAPAEMQLAHSTEYYNAFCQGTVENRIIRQLGLPWSPGLVDRAHRGVGGTIAAARMALKRGFAGALSGGTHHALHNEGRGFCVFNDIAVTALVLLESNEICRCAVLDLDAHQGNGTAEILGKKDNVFIVDLYGEKSYPVRKIPTHMDIPLPENIGDDAYLEKMIPALNAIPKFEPDLIIYIAGVDPLLKDRFGKLALSHAGLMARDHLVFTMAKSNSIPIVTTMGGGYANPIEHTVHAHLNTYRAAKQVFENPNQTTDRIAEHQEEV